MFQRIVEPFRNDGRTNTEIRNIKIKHHISHNNAHIIFYQQGQTIIKTHISSFTPTNKNTKFNTTIKFSSTAKKNLYSDESKIDEYSKILVSIFELSILSNCYFIVNLEVIQDDGCLLSSIINSISILLAINNILTTDLFVSVEVGKGLNGIIYDPNFKERSMSRIVMCCLVNRMTMSYVCFTGKVRPTEFKLFYEESKECVKLVSIEMKKFLNQISAAQNILKE